MTSRLLRIFLHKMWASMLFYEFYGPMEALPPIYFNQLPAVGF